MNQLHTINGYTIIAARAERHSDGGTTIIGAKPDRWVTGGISYVVAFYPKDVDYLLQDSWNQGTYFIDLGRATKYAGY